jgi:hypothetical protein
MIHEYAVEPTAVAGWERFRFVTSHMGIAQARLIAEYPGGGRWQALVRDACRARKLPNIERTRIFTKLAGLEGKLLKGTRPYRNSEPWLANAEAAHRKQPFWAIIASARPGKAEPFLSIDELDEHTPYWNVPRERAVARTAAALAACAVDLFRQCREILFVDPYFDPRAPRFQHTLTEFVRVAAATGRVYRRCEYHLKLVPSDDPFALERECLAHLSQLLPPGFKLDLRRWRHMNEGERMHPRYILTDVGGLRIEKGLDEGTPGETTDVSLLDPNLCAARLGEFDTQRPAYQLLDKATVCGRTPAP